MDGRLYPDVRKGKLISVDRCLPDAETVRATLAERTLTKLGDNERLERLHRVFYPVFRVEYRYSTGEGKLLTTDTKAATTLLDGLRTDNDSALTRYADGTAEFFSLDTTKYDFFNGTHKLGRSVLMQFQVSTGEAASLLPRRIEEYRNQPNGITNVLLQKLRDLYGLPADFDPDGFETVTDVQHCYLPFWLAELHSPQADDIALVSFRAPGADEDVMRQHGWLAAFVGERPQQLHLTSKNTDILSHLYPDG